MGKHSRPGPPDEPPETDPPGPPDPHSTPDPLDPLDPLAPYERRRRPPMGTYRRSRPLHGAASHVRPDEPRVLEEWDGFSYVLVGTAPDRATALAWVNAAGTGPQGEHG